MNISRMLYRRIDHAKSIAKEDEKAKKMPDLQQIMAVDDNA
jgi:hypothetical protein